MNPPLPTQIEVVVYGPGEGECILVHFGDNQWIIIDSTTYDNEPWAEWYFRHIGRDISTCVKLIVCTHWHSDHVKGISRLVELCASAKFVFSDAIRTDEFQHMVARFLKVPAGTQRLKAPHQEILNAFQHLNKISQSAAYQPPVPATQDMRLYRGMSQGLPVKIDALSPSHEDRMTARLAFAALTPALNQNATGLSPLSENKASVVIRLTVGQHSVLLGADLEHTSSQHSGWNSVNIQLVPQATTLLKVPHHGSSGSFSEELWLNKIPQNTFSIITPFRKHDLPRLHEIERLKNYTSNIYLSSIPKGSKVDRRSEVQRTMNGILVSYNYYRNPTEISLVSLITDIADPCQWKVCLEGTACRF